VAPQALEKLTPEQAVLVNAQTPISALPNPAAAPFVLPDVSTADRARAVSCLAMAVYYEAGNQGSDGEAAVAQVVLNRLRNPLFPKTICGVVFQGSERSTGCQFTFTCDGSLARRPSAVGWRDANEIAERALNGYVQKEVGEATHYHTIWVVPYWQSSVQKVVELGAHVFFRWDGALGPQAFRGQYAGSELETQLPAWLKDSDLLPKPPPPPAEISVATAATPRQPVVTLVAVAEHSDTPETPKVSLVTPKLPANLAAQPTGGYFSRDTQTYQRLPMR
jgi:hypothetical protein